MDVDTLRVDEDRVYNITKHMKIYTKTGDLGETSLYGGARVRKDSLRVNTYGEVDELDSFIGSLICEDIKSNHQSFLTNIQKNLYEIMNWLSGAKRINPDALKRHLEDLENEIDLMQKALPQLTYFILPQGSEISVKSHIIRTICRRTERSVVAYAYADTDSPQKIDEMEKLVIAYLNRLSDFFFVLARYYNQGSEISVKQN